MFINPQTLGDIRSKFGPYKDINVVNGIITIKCGYKTLQLDENLNVINKFGKILVCEPNKWLREISYNSAEPTCYEEILHPTILSATKSKHNFLVVSIVDDVLQIYFPMQYQHQKQLHMLAISPQGKIEYENIKKVYTINGDSHKYQIVGGSIFVDTYGQQIKFPSNYHMHRSVWTNCDMWSNPCFNLNGTIVCAFVY